MKEIKINLPLGGYTIYVQKNLLKDIGEFINPTARLIIITDDNVYRLHGEELDRALEGIKRELIILRPGEEAKSLEKAEYIYNRLLDYRATRRDILVAFGGGVIGDLVGFVASTYLRGVDYIQIPTTLLAQVDSSVGGKVAVNLPRGKNLIGSFYHPTAVFIDTMLLETLEERVFNDGMAEVIKYGCIKDRRLFYNLLGYTRDELMDKLEEVIFNCCNIKRLIVEKDERDFGERRILNFGHTLGHGIEKYFGYKDYTHGESVAIGMYNITKKSEGVGLTEEGTSEVLKEILRKYSLPYELPPLKKDKLMDIVYLDKKSEGGFINIVLLHKIGDGFIKKLKVGEFMNLYIGR